MFNLNEKLSFCNNFHIFSHVDMSCGLNPKILLSCLVFYKTTLATPNYSGPLYRKYSLGSVYIPLIQIDAVGQKL